MTLEIETRADDSDEKKYIVKGYATTFNEPYVLYVCDDWEYREQVSPDAFKECNMEDVIFQYDHEGRVYARLSNGTMKLDIDEHGLLVTADLGGTEEGRKLFEEIKGGYTTKMSFGFTVAEDEELRTHEMIKMCTFVQSRKSADYMMYLPYLFQQMMELKSLLGV